MVPPAICRNLLALACREFAPHRAAFHNRLDAEIGVLIVGPSSVSLWAEVSVVLIRHPPFVGRYAKYVYSLGFYHHRHFIHSTVSSILGHSRHSNVSSVVSAAARTYIVFKVSSATMKQPQRRRDPALHMSRTHSIGYIICNPHHP
jgi:hypothetical protein